MKTIIQKKSVKETENPIIKAACNTAWCWGTLCYASGNRGPGLGVPYTPLYAPKAEKQKGCSQRGPADYRIAPIRLQRTGSLARLYFCAPFEDPGLKHIKAAPSGVRLRPPGHKRGSGMKVVTRSDHQTEALKLLK